MKRIVSILTVLAIVASLFLMAMPMTVSAEAVEFSGDASQIPEGKIVLTDDIKGEFKKSSGKYEIDLNGHSWTHNGPAVYLTGTAELIIYNGTVDNSAGTSDGFSVEDNAKVTANNVTVIGGTGGADAFWIKGGTVSLTNCTVSAGKAGIDVDNGNGNVVVSVNGGKFVNYAGAADARMCAIEIRRDGAISLTGDITFENNKILAGTGLNKTLGESISVTGSYEATLADPSVNNPGAASPSTYTTISYKAVKVTKSIDYFNGVRGSIADCNVFEGQDAITLLGWIITDAGLSNVKYSIDGGTPVELGPTRARPDVVAHVKYTGELVAADKVGIGLDNEHAKIDISGLEIGEHVVKLYAFTNAGTQVEAGSFKVTILAPLADGEVADLSAIKEPGEYKLVADVKGNLTLTSGDYVIDLNGHTWTNGGIALNIQGAKVTLTDTVGTGYIKATNDCIDISSGSITVTDATVIAEGDSLDAIFVGGGVVVTNNATLYAGKSGINASQAAVDITVNGGTFGGVYSGERFVRTSAFEFRNNAKVKLNGDINFVETAIIRRSKTHTISWAESFIVGDDVTVTFAANDTDIGTHSGNHYYSNAISYTKSKSEPKDVGITSHSGHYGSPILWLKNSEHFYQMTINAKGAFNSIISSLWGANAGTTCTLDIYAWDTNTEVTLNSLPAASVTKTFTGNPANYVFDFETLEAGQYIIKVTCSEGYVVLPVADATNGVEATVSTKNESNIKNKYWVASIRFVDSNAASFDSLIEEVNYGDTEELPYMIFDQEYKVTVGAGKTFYINAFWGGMNVTITGEGNFSVVYNGTTYASENGKVAFAAAPSMGRMPTAFAIINNSEADAEYTLKGEYPEGTMMNPDSYDKNTDKTVEIEAGNADGYFYSFDADKDGSITLYISDITAGAEGNIVIQVIGADDTVKYLSLVDDGENGKLTADYKKGDKIVINVAVLPDENWNVPAASITIAEYTAGGNTGDFGLIALAFVAISSVVVKKRKEA